ncbi:MFS general substrate transporter [Lactarius hatsudake]|nr:MFS general substrate transporter [Lactarius hatsudake]
MSTANIISESTPDDETPLLSRGSNVSQRPTPLPIFQILILISVQLMDSIASNSITPYINQMIGELPNVGGDGRKVGYYTGITLSAFYAAEAATMLQWNRLSDRVGRKPILLSGLLGTTVSITMFGLSRSFWKLALCRFLSGALNGNIGVSKSVDRWPESFSHPFWSGYPYFLPCLVVAVLSFTQFTFTAIFFEEVGPLLLRQNDDALIHHQDGEYQPLPLRALLTRPVLTSVANYASLALLDIAAGALMALVWSTPIALASIGLWLSATAAFAATYILFPFENALARRGAEVTAVVWPLIALQLLSRSVTDTGFGAFLRGVHISLIRATNKRSLGATNGLAQTIVSIQRTVGPTVAVSLFTYSLQNNVLGGHFAYVIPASGWILIPGPVS